MMQLHTLVPFFRRFCPQFVHATKTHLHSLLARASLTP
jgi:hypothetical protein